MERAVGLVNCVLPNPQVAKETQGCRLIGLRVTASLGRKLFVRRSNLLGCAVFGQVLVRSTACGQRYDTALGHAPTTVFIGRVVTDVRVSLPVRVKRKVADGAGVRHFGCGLHSLIGHHGRCGCVGCAKCFGHSAHPLNKSARVVKRSSCALRKLTAYAF